MDRTARIAALALALGTLTACYGIDFHDNPGPAVRKDTGPLTVPPPGVLSGRAPG